MKKSLFILILFTTFKIIGQSQVSFDSIKNELSKIKLNSKIKNNNKRVLKLLDNLYYETLQSDDGFLSEKTISELKEFENNKDIPNWHIFYLFNIYQNHITESQNLNIPTNANFQIGVMKLLSGELIEVYNTIPPIILIYMGEALLSGNKIDLAKNHFKMSFEFFPKSIPLKVYCYLLSDDETEKQKLYRELKKEKPNHWMVIEKLN
ncbi:hypothetical protein [Flavobacterium tibetense]|uniref:Tetratricopeptide repeat protein n=1 Tax=Flavobacterium tibetense TaxID=2233533 RepID=A0A365P0S8_9FLAO|nr:hypothetical protein [Flavobacterium tibetense]RBA27933.1 hypothetical protein DPN68_09590 [Flavobacterium tibetense]